MAENFRIPSCSGTDELNCFRWMPSSEPVASLQIVHGMTEHILRYSGFAEFLASMGIAMYGHDHMGHGGTSDEKGFFADKDGGRVLIEDAWRVTSRMLEDLPGIPHAIMGHSMGSFVVRRYLTIHGKEVDGAIIMGTGQQSPVSVSAALAIAKTLCLLRGTHYVSRKLNDMVLGSYDKHFEGPDLPSRWLSSNPDTLRAYSEDPLCGFPFTVSAYRDLFTMIRDLGRRKGFDNLPSDLPVLMVSGADDPVGDFGKGVERAADGLRSSGLDPKVILYDGMRHEILNEIGSGRVYEDIRSWILSDVRRS